MDTTAAVSLDVDGWVAGVNAAVSMLTHDDADLNLLGNILLGNLAGPVSHDGVPAELWAPVENWWHNQAATQRLHDDWHRAYMQWHQTQQR